MYMFNGGGYGGHPEGDGMTYGSPIISVARSQPVELYEQRYPVRIRKFAIREESAGAGRYRGGFGAIMETEFIKGEGKASVLGDRGAFGPRGLYGGKDGEPCKIEFILDNQAYIPALSLIHISCCLQTDVLSPHIVCNQKWISL